MFLTRNPILAKNFLETAQDYKSGAGVVFLGKVRNHSGAGSTGFRHARENLRFSSSQARRVLYLEYEAYESMAEPMMEGLVREAHARWPLEEIKIAHRIGRVNLGEIAVAIQVNSAHRDEAYQASRFLIEEIKHQVPIWKKEYFEDGTSAWGSCAPWMSVARKGALSPC